MFGFDVSADYQAEISIAVVGFGARRLEAPVCSAAASYERTAGDLREIVPGVAALSFDEELAGFDHPIVHSEQVSGKTEYALSVLDHISGSTLMPVQTLGIQSSHTLNCPIRLGCLVSTWKTNTPFGYPGPQPSYPPSGSFSSRIRN